MNKINWKVVGPHIAAVGLFLLLSLVYNSPLLEGKRLVAHDDTMFRGASKEIDDFRKTDKQEPLWTNSMFGGMPSYTITFKTKNNFVGKIFRPVLSVLPVPAGQLFWAMLGFYIMLLTFGFKPYASAIGAIAYGFCSYNVIIVGAGHYAKLMAIASLPLVIAGINVIFKKHYLWGAALTGVAASIELLANHPQMTYYYYVFFLSLFMIYKLIDAILKKEVKHGIMASALTGFMIVAGSLTNANVLLPVSEYTPYSTRGPSELKKNVDVSDQTGGLPRSYIVGYSSGKDDVMSLLIPNYKGPNNGQLVLNKIGKPALGKDRAFVEQVEGLLYQNYGEIIDQYWGGQDATGGVVYSSVIIFALFLLGFLLVKHPVKWIVIPAFIVTMMLSWGKNYMGLTNWFIDHFPMYNKFRAVNSIIIVITFCVPLLASFTLARLVDKPEFLDKVSFGKFKNKHVLVGGLGIIILTLLAMYVSPESFQSFTKPAHFVDKVGKVMTERDVITEALQSQQVDAGTIDKTIGSIENARIAIFKADALRSLLFMVLASVAIGLYAFKKINWQIMLGVVGILVLVDVWQHDKRYLNENKFEDQTKAKAKFNPTPADQYILTDKGNHYRVLNMGVQGGAFNDASTCYFHRSLGGYSGAKIKRYQELIENYIYKDLNKIYASGGVNIDSVMTTTQILNMLDCKYVVFDVKSMPLTNFHAFGPAWMVSNIKWVPDADGELEALNSTDLRNTAVVDERFKSMITGTPIPDSSATITLTTYKSNAAEYDFNSSTDQVVVFSEIYYPAGWNAYIDGTPAEHFRTNYVLRGLFVPKGTHKIEFRFEPATYKKAENYSLIGSILVFLAIGAGAFQEYRKRSKKETPVKDESGK